MHHADLMVLARELNREPHGSHAMSIVLEELAEWLTQHDRLARSVAEKERRISELDADRQALQRECQQLRAKVKIHMIKPYRAQDVVQSVQKCIVCVNPVDLAKVKIHVIKLYRELFQSTLKEAKDAVEASQGYAEPWDQLGVELPLPDAIRYLTELHKLGVTAMLRPV